jgi:hypothetical protein
MGNAGAAPPLPAELRLRLASLRLTYGTDAEAAPTSAAARWPDRMAGAQHAHVAVASFQQLSSSSAKYSGTGEEPPYGGAGAEAPAVGLGLEDGDRRLKSSNADEAAELHHRRRCCCLLWWCWCFLEMDFWSLNRADSGGCWWSLVDGRRFASS